MPRPASVKIFLTFVLKKDETNIQFTKMINMMGPDYSSIENAYLAYQIKESNLTLNLCEFDLNYV